MFGEQAIDLVASYSGGLEETSPKGRRRRSVPMADAAAAELARLGQRPYFTSADDLVFCGATGDFIVRFAGLDQPATRAPTLRSPRPGAIGAEDHKSSDAGFSSAHIDDRALELFVVGSWPMPVALASKHEPNPFLRHPGVAYAIAHGDADAHKDGALSTQGPPDGRSRGGR